MKHKANFFRGMTSVFAFLMALVLSATTITFQYAGLINGFMGIETTRVIIDETAVGTMFYENEYGYDAESLPDVYADAAELNANIVAEGTVLLKNDNSALPVACCQGLFHHVYKTFTTFCRKWPGTCCSSRPVCVVTRFPLPAGLPHEAGA